jgi:dihydrofolate reductase
MVVSLVVAVAENGVIGRDNALPWRLPNDLKFFKRTTLGHPILMGRATFESIGRPLPGRSNLVLSHNPALQIEGCTVVHSLEAAIAASTDAQELMVIGGAQVYAQILPRADRIYLTRVHADVSGDSYFPAFDTTQWRADSTERHEADAQHAYAYSFITLQRV